MEVIQVCYIEMIYLIAFIASGKQYGLQQQVREEVRVC